MLGKGLKKQQIIHILWTRGGGSPNVDKRGGGGGGGVGEKKNP